MNERGDFVGRRGQADQIVAQPADERGPIGFGRGGEREARLPPPSENEMIDLVDIAVAFRRLGHGRISAPAERPTTGDPPG